jgi:hypothetical protein
LLSVLDAPMIEEQFHHGLHNLEGTLNAALKHLERASYLEWLGLAGVQLQPVACF